MLRTWYFAFYVGHAFAMEEDQDSCSECGCAVEYDFDLRTSACTGCGKVASDGSAPLVNQWNESSNNVVLPVLPIAASGLPKETLERRVGAFTKAAVSAARATGDNSPTLFKEMRELGATVLSRYAKVPFGRALVCAGAAAALLRARRSQRDITISDVAAAVSVTPQAARVAYEQLATALGEHMPLDAPDLHLSRFRHAATALLGGSDSAESWATVSSRARTVLHIAQALWMSQGRRPVLVAAATVVIAVRAASLDLLLPQVLSQAICVRRLAAAADINENTLGSISIQLSRDMAAVDENMPRNQIHAYIDVVHDKLFEMVDGMRRLRTNKLPQRLSRSDKTRKQRKDVLRRIRDSIGKSRTLNTEERALVALVRAGASREQVLRGKIDDVARSIVNDAAEAVDDLNTQGVDSDVEDSIRTEKEIVMYSALLATADDSETS